MQLFLLKRRKRPSQAGLRLAGDSDYFVLLLPIYIRYEPDRNYFSLFLKIVDIVCNI